MAFFRSAAASDTGARPKVESFIMSDGTFCINDPKLVKVISSEVTLPEHEEEFKARISDINDRAAAQFFTDNPDL
jgi:hypothetical protein